jgi:hypothetical protein
VTDPLRKQYRPLEESQVADLAAIKDVREKMLDVLAGVSGDGRCFALAKTKIEEAVMWAAKGITA